MLKDIEQLWVSPGRSQPWRPERRTTPTHIHTHTHTYTGGSTVFTQTERQANTGINLLRDDNPETNI